MPVRKSGQLWNAYTVGKTADVVVRRMHLEQHARLPADGGPIVAQVGPVRGSYLHQTTAGALHELGKPEAAADLDELTAGHDHLPPEGGGVQA